MNLFMTLQDHCMRWVFRSHNSNIASEIKTNRTYLTDQMDVRCKIWSKPWNSTNRNWKMQKTELQTKKINKHHSQLTFKIQRRTIFQKSLKPMKDLSNQRKRMERVNNNLRKQMIKIKISIILWNLRITRFQRNRLMKIIIN